MRNRPDPEPVPEDRVLRTAVQRDLAGPLAALRAALESLARDHGRDRAPLLERALVEVVRLEQRVEALAEIVGPGELHPAACSVEEVARAALRTLGRDRGRVWLALEQGEHRLDVDAASLTRVLAGLLTEALGRGARDLLLHSCCDSEHLTFTIVDDLSATEGELPPRDEELVDSIELLLSKREAQRLGGSVHVARVTSAHFSTTLEIPLGPRSAA